MDLYSQLELLVPIVCECLHSMTTHKRRSLISYIKYACTLMFVVNLSVITQAIKYTH